MAFFAVPDFLHLWQVPCPAALTLAWMMLPHCGETLAYLWGILLRFPAHHRSGWLKSTVPRGRVGVGSGSLLTYAPSQPFWSAFRSSLGEGVTLCVREASLAGEQILGCLLAFLHITLWMRLSPRLGVLSASIIAYP